MLKGRAHKYGDNIDTDVIIPARYCTSFLVEDLAPHCLEDLDPNFVKKVSVGDILVAGNNFGCGSSRENAPIAIKGVGVSCIIAKSYARIFYRNAINIGLPILQFPDINAFDSGDLLDIDFGKGIIRNITSNESYSFSKFPTFLQKIIKLQGLINFAKEQIANSEEGS